MRETSRKKGKSFFPCCLNKEPCIFILSKALKIILFLLSCNKKPAFILRSFICREMLTLGQRLQTLKWCLSLPDFVKMWAWEAYPPSERMAETGVGDTLGPPPLRPFSNHGCRTVGYIHSTEKLVGNAHLGPDPGSVGLKRTLGTCLLHGVQGDCRASS